MKNTLKKALKEKLGVDLRSLKKREKQIFDLLVEESEKEVLKNCVCGQPDDDWFFS